MNVIVEDKPSIFLLCVSSQPRPCMNILVRVKESMFFFYYVLPASHDHENMTVLVQEVQSILLFIICFQLATTMNALIIQEVRSNFYFGIFKLFLCVSIQPRPGMNIIVQVVESKYFLLCASTQPRPCMNVIVEENQFIFFIMRFYLATAMYVHSCPRGPVFFLIILLYTSSQLRLCMNVIVETNQSNCIIVYFQLGTTLNELITQEVRSISYYVFLDNHYHV